MKLKSKQNESGNAIVITVSVMATLMVMVGVAVEYTGTISRHVQRSNTLETAVSIADGCLEQQFAYWREVCRTNTNYPAPSSWMTPIPLPAQASFPNVPNFTAKRGTNINPAVAEHDPAYTVSGLKVVAVDPQLKALASVSATPNPGIGMSGNTATYNYVASANVTLPTVRGNIVAKVRRVFQKEQLSPWNWAIFYVDPLEIHPGPEFHVDGWVHTNADLFTAHKTLYFDSKVTYAQDWEVAFRSGDPRALGGPQYEVPTSPNYVSNLPPALDIAHQPFGLDATRIFSTADANPNNDSYHELVEPPTAGYADPLAGRRYYDQAGLKVTVDGSNNVTIKKTDGTTLSTSSTGTDLALYNMVNNALTTNQTIQDNREQASVRLVTLDMDLMLDKTGGTYSWKTNFNGIIYLQDNSAAANGVGAKRGIRIKNGKYVPTGGVTLASPNPIYIQGDFNTGNNPPSNSGDPTDPEGSGYTRQACSIIGDAVNILSNAWNDANSSAGLGSRVATPTTVNSAIVSGIVPTASNIYSGGAENFPRFLEDWTNKTFTYYGSMVQLYNSRQSIGTWGSSNVYVPPTRNWYFDNNFKIYTPPGSLMVYSYIKGKWSLVP